MKKLLYITLAVLGLFFMACPYESEVELNTYENSLKIDKSLLGEWVAYHEDGSKEELVIEKLNKTVGHIKHRQFNSKKQLEASFSYRIYSTDLDGITILNIENTKEAKYMFAKYAWTGKHTFDLQTIKNEFIENNFKVDSVTTKNLRSFLIDNVNKEALYDEKIEFYRKNSPDHNMVKAYMRKSGF